MPEHAAPMWERHQRFTAFFQAQLNTVQQGAIAAQAGIPFIILMIDRIWTATPDEPPGVRAWIGGLAWLILGCHLLRAFQTDAHRMLATYEAEWELEFPGIPAQRLASFLLNSTYRQREHKSSWWAELW